MSERTNLNNKVGSGKYIWMSLMLLVISAAGIYWLKREPAKTEEIVLTQGETKEQELPTQTESVDVAAMPSDSPTPSLVPSAIPTINPIGNFEDKDMGFSVKYDNNRTLYQDNERTGKRYTFYSGRGNITVHAGNTWSWVYPERVFSETLPVGGEKSFVYETATQKIVDVEKGETKYTIQCVHNGLEDLKTECDDFIANFRFI